MKIQLIILGLFVVTTLAHRHKNSDDEDQVGTRRHFRGRRRNDNQVAANAEDAELEDSISAEEGNVGKGSDGRNGCGSGRGSRRGGRRGERGGRNRHGFKHDPEWHRRNGVEMQEGGDQQFSHNSEWHEKHGQPMPDENSGIEKHRHRHHHHRHHRNQTTTTTTSTTTTTNPPSFDSNE